MSAVSMDEIRRNALNIAQREERACLEQARAGFVSWETWAGIAATRYRVRAYVSRCNLTRRRNG